MAKQHAPGFLKLVTDAKTRVKECTVDDVREKLALDLDYIAQQSARTDLGIMLRTPAVMLGRKNGW